MKKKMTSRERLLATLAGKPTDRAFLPQTGANLYFNGARPHVNEVSPLTLTEFDPAIKLVEHFDGWFLEMTLDRAGFGARGRLARAT